MALARADVARIALERALQVLAHSAFHFGQGAWGQRFFGAEQVNRLELRAQLVAIEFMLPCRKLIPEPPCCLVLALRLLVGGPLFRLRGDDYAAQLQTEVDNAASAPAAEQEAPAEEAATDGAIAQSWDRAPDARASWTCRPL